KITVKANTVDALDAEDPLILGYKLDETRIPEVEAGDKVENGTVVNFYYVKDESQTNKLEYTVNHITVTTEGEKTVKSDTYSEDVYVLDEQKVTVKENTVDALDA